MKYNEIEDLKSALTQLVKKGCRLKNDEYGVNGKVVGMGFKPCWTNPVDSKIEKLEFNYLDRHGGIVPFYLYNIIGYDIVSKDKESLGSSANITLDLHVFSSQNSHETEAVEKVRIGLSGE